MDIASFVGATTSTHDVTMVHKFPNKLAHSFNKLSFNKATVFHLAILVLRFTGSIDLAVIITKILDKSRVLRISPTIWHAEEHFQLEMPSRQHNSA